MSATGLQRLPAWNTLSYQGNFTCTKCLERRHGGKKKKKKRKKKREKALLAKTMRTVKKNEMKERIYCLERPGPRQKPDPTVGQARVVAPRGAS